MKIALLTIWHVKNYGAELQAYATIKILQKLGHEVEIIDIRLSDCIKANMKGKIGSFISSFGPGDKKFRTFWKKYIPVSRRYYTVEDLQKNPPKADLYIVGSDQVWNPDLTAGFSKLFFLDFGNSQIKRISYASSFGKETWSHPSLTNEISNLLSRFSYITCREDSGVLLLEKVFGLNSKSVVDPTLLLGDFQDLLIKPLTNKQTLVYYPLTDDEELENAAMRLSKKLGLLPVNNKLTTHIIPGIPWNQTGIEEWVTNIASAQFILTRSFHGMLFALIYKKQFAVIAGNQGRGTRIVSVLNRLGIIDRYCPSVEEFESAELWNSRIDYSILSPKIEKMRSDSMTILKNMLD